MPRLNAIIAHDQHTPVLKIPYSVGYGCLALGLALVAMCSVLAIVRHTLGSERCSCRSGRSRSRGDMSTVLIAAFFVLLALSFPVAHALVIGATLGVMTSDHFSLYGIIQQLFVPTQSFPLIAIPFFVMAAELMMNGTLGRNLIDFATDLVGRFRGGHAQVSVLGSTLFGGVSGSAVADATALGGMLIPWQVKAGYPRAFCGATIAAASTIDILIPPSIPLILYSLVSNASIGALFFAGILPGLLLAVGFLAVCNISARLRGFPYEKTPVAWGQMARRGLYAMPAL